MRTDPRDSPEIQTPEITQTPRLQADADQQTTNSAKNQAHVDVITAYTAAHAERIDLQLAADQGWTFHDPANSAIRRDFKIPPDRPAVE